MKQLPSVNSELDDELIDKIFKNHFDILSPFFLKLMSEWTIGAYKAVSYTHLTLPTILRV